jgi:hypothetical protein
MMFDDSGYLISKFPGCFFASFFFESFFFVVCKIAATFLFYCFFYSYPYKPYESAITALNTWTGDGARKFISCPKRRESPRILHNTGHNKIA